MVDETFNLISAILLSVTVIAGIATAIVYYHQLKVMQRTLQEQTRFNRLAYRPSLTVNREKLENERVIQIDNNEHRAAYEAFICSFLLSSDGNQHVILYDETRQFIVHNHPVAQGDILRHDFRAQFVSEDVTRYGSPLKTRLDQFFSQHSEDGRFLLVVSIRTPFHAAEETALFFFAATKGGGVESANWQSIHLPKHSSTFKAALSVANKYYDSEIERNNWLQVTPESRLG